MNISERFQRAGESWIAPDLFGAALGLKPETLAHLAGVDASTLTRAPDDARLQRYLKDAVQAIAAAGDIAESPERAIAWFRHTAIPELGDRTPEQLVARCETEVLTRYLASVGGGASG